MIERDGKGTLVLVLLFVAITLFVYTVVFDEDRGNENTDKGNESKKELQISHDTGFKVLEPLDMPNTKPDEKEAVTLGDVVTEASGAKVLKATFDEDPGGKDKVVKQRSSIDYKYYYVSDVLGDKLVAANKLAELNRRVQYLLQTIDESLDNGARVYAKDGADITTNMRQLVNKHHNKALPVAEYNSPKDNTVGTNSDKGMLIEVCLRSKYNSKEWNSDNTLFRVMAHELAHSADHAWRGDGDHAHGPDFFRLHNHLLKVGEDIGVYNCNEYKMSGRKHCGLVLTEKSNCGE